MANANTVGTWNGARREMEQDGWLVVRTLGGGTTAMRNAGEVFTPRIEKEKAKQLDYSNRLARSVLHPGYSQTVAKLSALPFGKPPVVGEVPKRLKRIEEDADRMGQSLAMFAKSIYHDAIDRGLGMFLVDNVPIPAEGLRLDVAQDIDARPYFVRIAPDNLVGFNTGTKYGREVCTELRYREWLYRPDAMGLDSLVERVRVWTETEVQVWEMSRTQSGTVSREQLAGAQSSGGYQLVESFPHGFAGIPLVIVYTKRIGFLHGKPPLLELAWLNVAHWNSDSIQGEAVHYGRAPTFKALGVTHETAEQMQGGAVKLGVGSTFVDTSSDVDIGFIEIAGSSLQAGERHVDRLERQMEALGMQPLFAAGGPETATGEIRADVAEKSEAQSWVEAMEWGIVQGYQFAAKWIGETLPDDFTVTLWKDSSLLAGKSQDMGFLQADATAGRITAQRYLTEAKRRGLYADDMDPEQEALEVEQAAERSMQRQMDAMAAKMIAERPGQEPGQQDRPDETDSADEPQETAA